MKVLLSSSFLAGALEATAKRDVRKSLTGVCVDFLNEEEVVIAGTDGYILVAVKCTPTFEERGKFIGQIVIPRANVAVAVKVKETFVVLSATKYGYALDSIVFEPIEHKFPPYARIIPDKISGEVGSYDLATLSRVAKSVQKATGADSNPPVLYQNGRNAAAIQGQDTRVIGVIMPLHRANPEFTVWTKPITTKE